jgi:phosphopantetheinyl transferase
MALASLLLQKHYICLSTARKWDSVDIRRTSNGKPYFKELQYNVSLSCGIVVLVGFQFPVGVDIVRRDSPTPDLSASELSLLFSAVECELLSKCSTQREFNDLYFINWAFKEAYMKFTGTPDWDNLLSIEFLNIQAPSIDEPCITNAVGRVLVKGQPQLGYTEVHNIDDNYFVAIYTSDPPDEGNTQFRRITLEEISAPLSIEM